MIQNLLAFLGRYRKALMISGGILLAANLFLWSRIFAPAPEFEINFLNVGQGDSSLLMLQSAAILIDAGPATDAALRELDLRLKRRTIDLAVITHPELDHFGGFLDLLERYRIGAIVWNGRDSESELFEEFRERSKALGIPWIVVRAGDRIRYGSSTADVLWPRMAAFSNSSANETGIVLRFSLSGVQMLFMADTGEDTEQKLAPLLERVDVLKVGHHGSRFSSSADFLNAIDPLVALIGVGKNSYGHPTPEVLHRLSNVGAKIFRTDRDGTVRVNIENGSLKIFVSKN